MAGGRRSTVGRKVRGKPMAKRSTPWGTIAAVVVVVFAAAVSGTRWRGSGTTTRSPRRWPGSPRPRPPWTPRPGSPASPWCLSRVASTSLRPSRWPTPSPHPVGAPTTGPPAAPVTHRAGRTTAGPPARRPGSAAAVLSDPEQPPGRVHRVPDVPLNAARDEPVSPPKLNRVRPVLAQSGVRPTRDQPAQCFVSRVCISVISALSVSMMVCARAYASGFCPLLSSVIASCIAPW